MPESNRGRGASWPIQIPLAGWKDIAFKVKESIGRDNLTIVSAGIAFYAFLAVFPAIAAVVSIYGLISNPADVEAQLARLAGVLPPEVLSVLLNQLSRIAEADHTVSLGLLISLLLTLWSASRGMKGMIIALNIVYKQTERRSFIRFNVVGLFFTICAIVFLILSLSLIVAVPALLGHIGLSDHAASLTRALRWPLLGILVALGLALLYRYAPNRGDATVRWVTTGSIVATLLWLVVSVGFSEYIAHFGDYSAIYGSLGAIVILLLWFYFSAFVILLGAELNAAMEHQTALDPSMNSHDTPEGTAR